MRSHVLVYPKPPCLNLSGPATRRRQLTNCLRVAATFPSTWHRDGWNSQGDVDRVQTCVGKRKLNWVVIQNPPKKKGTLNADNCNWGILYCARYWETKGASENNHQSAVCTPVFIGRQVPDSHKMRVEQLCSEAEMQPFTKWVWTLTGINLNGLNLVHSCNHVN